jgi:hypothetical protein
MPPVLNPRMSTSFMVMRARNSMKCFSILTNVLSTGPCAVADAVIFEQDDGTIFSKYAHQKRAPVVYGASGVHEEEQRNTGAKTETAVSEFSLTSFVSTVRIVDLDILAYEGCASSAYKVLGDVETTPRMSYRRDPIYL